MKNPTLSTTALLSLCTWGPMTLGTLAAFAVPAAAFQDADVQAAEVAGRWDGSLPFSGRIELEPYALVLTQKGEAVEGSFLISGQELPVAGLFDAATGDLDLTLDDDEDSGEFDLVLRNGALAGTFTHSRVGSAQIAATRLVERPEPERLVVDFTLECPETVAVADLPADLAEQVRAAIAREMENQLVVGLSAAIVVDGELIDVRAFGWEDHHAGVAATGDTRYRWASISKPLTAVAALQLTEAGKLDLDVDARKYVPEFPEKSAVFTTRQLLCHQSGIVHYRNMQMRTLHEYDHPHPWTDEIIALDMFNESPLLFEPGTRYSYTTPGFVLLAAVIASAAETSYSEQVSKSICKPLGMTTMEPDRQWGAPIPNRSKGYHRDGDDVVDSGDNNISWKLGAGGWISTVGDLARFGAGLMGPDLLSVETQIAMWKPQKTADGQRTGYGLGIGVGSSGDVMTVSHSGGQRKTSTFLVCAPEYGIAVALMCNTSGTGLGGLAQEILQLVIESQDG